MRRSVNVASSNSELDLEMFTTAILLLSSVSKIVREEIDELNVINVDHGLALDRLRRSYATIAALAAIADHYKEGDCP